MIKSNHSSIRYEQESILEHRSYTLVALAIMIEAIMMFILLLTKTTNLTLIDHTSTQKINQIFSQKSEIEVYFFYMKLTNSELKKLLTCEQKFSHHLF